MSKTMSGSKNRTKSTLKKLIKNLKRYVIIKTGIKRRALIITPCVLAISLMILASISFDVTYALAVNCNGKTVGYVTSEKVYNETIEKISEDLGDDADEYLSDVDIVEQVAPVGTILDKKDLEKAIIENVDDVNKYYGLFKNGELYAVSTKKADLEDALEEYLYANCGEMKSPGFVDDFKIEKGYYPSEKEILKHELYALMSADETQVGGYEYVTSTKDIKYKTVKTKSDKYANGEEVLLRNGKNGKQRVTEKVFYVNGVEQERETVERIVLRKAIDRKVAVGSGASAIKLTVPMKQGSYVITSPFGEARTGYYHQGIDMVADYGTPIYAAAGGTVVESGYSTMGWGYTVLIDHGNGYKTRYAHCSSLSVKVGQKVARRELIAKVGSTGDSTANHLHFELYRNGVRVNPASYYYK